MPRILAALLIATVAAHADEARDQAVEEDLLHYQLYLDVGYLHSDNQPANRTWRTKSTSWKLDRFEVNLAMAQAWKETTPESRWGFELGLQYGRDAELADPEDDTAVGSAEYLKYLYRANLSYLLPVGRGLELRGGIIQGYPAYESYLAIRNPTYTRGYLTDYVPYFLIGLQADYAFTDEFDLSFFVVGGYDYLVHRNDVPGLGLRTNWSINDRITWTQNLYYGPEQDDTSLEYWRVFSDTVLEYRAEPLVFAASIDVGTEEQTDGSRSNWWAAALWARWEISRHWWLGCRPEIYSDPDGLMTGARQEIVAFAITAKYWFFPDEPHSLVACLEYRYDKSTGPDGGFFSGDDNSLVPDQHLIILSLIFSFPD